ncbi:MAG TPA: RtcB family protein [Pyrinomonadaceae bacterium]|nr:RtcB family protein [Pyrinomonadaceae bacterium]
MGKKTADAKALKVARTLHNAENWKHHARWHGDGYYELHTEDTGTTPVRLFLTKQLLDDAEDILYRQIVNATRFPGVRMVVITPDTHYGYGVPVGCVLITDAEAGAVAMGPVGYDIGCFTADTLIPLADGRTYPIGELAERGGEIFVYAISQEQKIVVAGATAKKTRIDAPLVKVTLDNDREIFCTPDHEFMLRDGTYRQAQELTPKTSLMPFDVKVERNDYVALGHPGVWNSQSAFSYNHKVVSVERLEQTADVFCLTVPAYGNFALDAGVFVHNCGMMSARSEVEAERATPEKRLEFNRAVMERVNMGAGGKSVRLGELSKGEFNNLVRGGAEYYVERYGATFDRSRAERHRIPVDDGWQIPWGGKGRPERGLNQLGSLGGGNHFIELQRSEQTGTIFVQVHTGSRGFGHGLATNYFELAREERPEQMTDIDLGYFTPDSLHYSHYLNAVAAGGNYAILNRLIIFEQVSDAFREVFGRELELIYEISHNLVQREWHPDFGDVWVHRKGATRAFPAGHPALAGTHWAETGHPVLIPGSNKDWSYILQPLAGAVNSGYSVNHGAGRRLSRGEATRTLSQTAIDDEYKAAGILVNINGRVPLDEAAPAYKSSQAVIEAVVGAGLARVEHQLWPLASLKGADERKGKRRKGGKGDAHKGRKTKEHY